jgi:hypothetical protein
VPDCARGAGRDDRRDDHSRGTPPTSREPRDSVITTGDEAGGRPSASAWTDGAAIRADAREGVHLHFALPVTDSHRAVRQKPRTIWTA